MATFRWDGDRLTVKEIDPMDAKREVTWEVRLEKHGGWWYKVYKNGDFVTEGATENKRYARAAAEGLLNDLLTFVDTSYVLKQREG